jgi:hypothetical protein
MLIFMKYHSTWQQPRTGINHDADPKTKYSRMEKAYTKNHKMLGSAWTFSPPPIKNLIHIKYVSNLLFFQQKAYEEHTFSSLWKSHS